jgi:uncharacterized protein involved in exopolysaccharide biosynthesis
VFFYIEKIYLLTFFTGENKLAEKYEEKKKDITAQWEEKKKAWSKKKEKLTTERDRLRDEKSSLGIEKAQLEGKLFVYQLQLENAKKM